MPSVPTPKSSSPPTSKAGIIETTTGARHIPASIRADGSKRKEIRIRPGYKPPEDVEVYKNWTADAWKNRGQGGVPGAEASTGDDGNANGGGKSEGKNAKRREARKKAKAADVDVKSEEPVKSDDETNESAKEPAVVDEAVDNEKKARGLKKKLKQARELKEKKEGGAALLPEQFAKVIKIQELVRELDALGFDADGEPKAKP